MAQQEFLITTQGEEEKSGRLRKDRTQRHREREREREREGGREGNSQQKHFLVQRDKRHLGNYGYVCARVCARLYQSVYGHARATIS